MTVAPGSILKLTSGFTLQSGTIMQNIYHFRCVFATAQTEAQVRTTLQSWLEDLLDNLELLTFDEVVSRETFVDVVEWSPTETRWEVVQNVGSFIPSFTPTQALDPMPDQNSPYVVFKTARPKTVGKKKLFPFTETSFDGSTLSASLVTAIVAYAADAMDDAVIGLLDYMVPGVPRTAVDAFYDFALAVVTNIVGTQRSRKPGVGE